MMLQRMSQESRDVIQRLIEHGYEAYYVGGCVRDAWLNRSITDIDITSSAHPEQIMACFTKTIPTGLQHGTVTVMMAHSTYEVTTFRRESNYEDHRRPQEVEFVHDLIEDLQRRDFTMNAMAMNSQGVLIDPFAGQKDIEAGVLRCVGSAEERFREDALRMLRCIRFAATYQLVVEAKTWQALVAQAPLMRHIAMERVRVELQRMVASPDVARAIDMLIASRVVQYFKQQVELPFTRWLAHEALLSAVDELSAQHTRWALLMILLDVPVADVRQALRALTFSRAEQVAITSVLSLHDDLRSAVTHRRVGAQEFENSPHAQSLEHIWKLSALRHSVRVAQDWLQLAEVLRKAIKTQHTSANRNDPHSFVWVHHIEPQLMDNGLRWLQELTCSSIHELDVSGDILIRELNKPAGPWVRALLQQLLEHTAIGLLPNERQALVQAARSKSNQGE